MKRLERRLTAKLTRIELERFLRGEATHERTLDLGASAGFYSSLFPSRVSVDIRRAPGVQVIADAQRLGIRSNAFPVVLCTEVLEHLPDPQAGIDEIYRVLEPGGRLILTTRFLFPIHDAPGDYFRFTRYGLEHLLRRFEAVSIREEAPPLGTMAILIQRLAFQTDTRGGRSARLMWHLVARAVRCLDGMVRREYGDSRRTTSVRAFASGYYVTARKPRDERSPASSRAGSAVDHA